MQTNVIQLVWHREYNVVMLHWQGVLHQVVNPEGLPGGLAFGTVPVAAAIVTVAYGSAVFASFLMSAQGSRSATGYFAQHPVLQWGKFGCGNQPGAE